MCKPYLPRPLSRMQFFPAEVLMISCTGSCEKEQGYSWKSAQAILPAHDVVTFPDHCLYSCVVNESSHMAGRGTQRVTSSDVRLFHIERANRSQDSTEDVYENSKCLF